MLNKVNDENMFMIVYAFVLFFFWSICEFYVNCFVFEPLNSHFRR